MTPRRDPVGLGADRAAAERARRRGTPLVSPASPESAAGAEESEDTGLGRLPNRPQVPPVEVIDLVAEEAGRAMAEAMVVPRSTARRLEVVPDLAGEPAAGPPDESLPDGDAPAGAPEDPEGHGTEEGVDDPAHLTELLLDAVEFVRRRLSGDFAVDEFGFDPELTERVMLNVLRPVYERWFRVELRGADRIPADRGALLVGNHSGTLAWDALMTQVAVHDSTGGRFLRLLGADLVFATPVMGDVARRMGATLAASSDAERLLSGGELVGVWPEGFKGIGKNFRDRYRLQRFGRGGFVAAAIRTQVPIVPVSIVGAEEIYPMLADVRPLARLTGAPYWPLTPTWPWFGPLGLVPLPSKWLIEFGEPVPTDQLDPGAADDPMVVFEITDRVRETIQQTLYALLVRRRSVFLG
ncbi:lysophospholipid acyltransferase family protein [Aquipuribacter hungaricus]|uniref:Lysophospholipid acyltransferase family protein n=2 Tax=Aquipuribacter hungaricus TaxID=545624 RepID=A0ABV7WKS4_9MICO